MIMITPDSLKEVALAICSKEKLRLLSEIGRGSFKKVYSTEDSTGQKYALKIIKDTTLSERTIREIEAIRKCNHPNIAVCTKMDSCNYEGVLYEYLLEELLEGGSLQDRLGQNGILQPDTIRHLGSILIDVLGHLSQHHLVHRDIKPENVLFRDSCFDPVLVDFGIVRDLNSSSLTNTWQLSGPGTPYYASPEQLTNSKSLIGWRTDQFSLGIVLSIAAFKTHPYQMEGESEFSPYIVERVSKSGERNQLILQKITESGLSCLDKMTRPWPFQRFRTVEELKINWEKQ